MEGVTDKRLAILKYMNSCYSDDDAFDSARAKCAYMRPCNQRKCLSMFNDDDIDFLYELAQRIQRREIKCMNKDEMQSEIVCGFYLTLDREVIIMRE